MKLVKKPWGAEKHFIINEKCTVKILIVHPKQRLSLQKHKRRKEVWYFLTEGFAQLGKKKIKVKEGKLVKISKGTIHRLFAEDKEVKVGEISSGEYDKNDIIRIEDDYGRVK